MSFLVWYESYCYCRILNIHAYIDNHNDDGDYNDSCRDDSGDDDDIDDNSGDVDVEWLW